MDCEVFASYVHSFYGKNGMYDLDATPVQIDDCIERYLKILKLQNKENEFCGDSIDRENIRDLLVSVYNLKPVKRYA
jgi:hypothetical protein